ncbi:MAG: 2-oxoacid:acceptor oxidoreductase family protein [Clostridia bacterium]|nr:2-oxoacid:acceptor oxidoreductase family protein [Clostridia bacterium]
MSTYKMFFAGSGGQGVLLMGQIITYAAMLEGKEATFLPSYGPEMRGGTANCTVVVSDKPVSSPLIYEADIAVVMNRPSMDKFEPMVKAGGYMFYNESIIDRKPERTDIKAVAVDLAARCAKLGNDKVANMAMLGEVVRGTGVVQVETVFKVFEKVFSGRKAALIPLNKQAFMNE